MTVRIGFEPSTDEGDSLKEKDVQDGDSKDVIEEVVKDGELGEVEERVELRLVFFADDSVRNVPVDEGMS